MSGTGYETLWERIDRNRPKMALSVVAFVIAWAVGAEVAIVLPILDWRLALVVLIPLPLLSIGFWRYSARYAERTRVLQEELAVATALAEETVSGIRVVKGLGAGPELLRRFRVASDRIVDRALAVADVFSVSEIWGTESVAFSSARISVYTVCCVHV